ncbi:MAG: hypothetical protein IPP96_06125 [Chitinophagaceae bacterium]|nr:hypothetical protein [Chitinophagaceae bacterium]
MSVIKACLFAFAGLNLPAKPNKGYEHHKGSINHGLFLFTSIKITRFKRKLNITAAFGVVTINHHLLLRFRNGGIFDIFGCKGSNDVGFFFKRFNYQFLQRLYLCQPNGIIISINLVVH